MDTPNGMRFTRIVISLDRKRFLIGLACAVAAGVALMRVRFASPDSAFVEPAADRIAQQPARPEGRFVALPSRPPMGEARGELFGPPAPLPVAVAARSSAPQPRPKPAAPALPYRIAGQVVEEDGMRVVLAKGDRIFEVRQGETLDGGYRLEAIAPRSLTFLYVPLGITQELAVAGGGLDLPTPRREPLSAPPHWARVDTPRGPARLRFAGPRDVRPGTPFDVVLKVDSEQPVRALPVQLSYDAKRLRPIAVRAGNLFAGGEFMYRISRDGSIFVGASGPSRAAVDSDLLVVTFDPIAAGPAELKVSSLLVQGASGRAIAHEAPQVFRAAVQ